MIEWLLSLFANLIEVLYFYGFLVSFLYYLFSSRRWDRAAFVVPMTALMGWFAGSLNFSLIALALIVFLIYHLVSFFIYGMLAQQFGASYVVFVIFNFITTFSLLQFVKSYID